MNAGNAISPAAAMLQILSRRLGFAGLSMSLPKLSIADLFAREGRLRSQSLQPATGANEGALFRILRALASLGVFRGNTMRGRFALTPLGRLSSLRRAGVFCAAFAIYVGRKGASRRVGTTCCTVSGPAKQRLIMSSAHPHFHYFASNPEAARVFNEGMTSRAGAEKRGHR